jgi:hypothetical protein
VAAGGFGYDDRSGACDRQNRALAFNCRRHFLLIKIGVVENQKGE